VEDVTRSCAAGCLASLMCHLPEEEQAPIMTDTLLQDDAALDWTVRHGRSSSLAVMMDQSPQTVLIYQEKVVKTILSYMAADSVGVVANGVRAAGYLIRHSVITNIHLPSEILSPFLRCMNNSSNDVKILVSQMISLIARCQPTLLKPELLKPIIPTLINGTMEKNSMVRSCSESALVDVLQLRKGPKGQAEILSLIDAGAKESLLEIISKSLTKLATQQEDKLATLDDTQLN